MSGRRLFLLVIFLLFSLACSGNSSLETYARQSDMRFAQVEKEIASLRQDLEGTRRDAAAAGSAQSATADAVRNLADRISVIEKRVGEMRIELLKLLNKQHK